jgi:hypothetical protein
MPARSAIHWSENYAAVTSTPASRAARSASGPYVTERRPLSELTASHPFRARWPMRSSSLGVDGSSDHVGHVPPEFAPMTP